MLSLYQPECNGLMMGSATSDKQCALHCTADRASIHTVPHVSSTHENCFDVYTGARAHPSIWHDQRKRSREKRILIGRQQSERSVCDFNSIDNTIPWKVFFSGAGKRNFGPGPFRYQVFPQGKLNASDNEHISYHPPPAPRFKNSLCTLTLTTKSCTIVDLCRMSWRCPSMMSCSLSAYSVQS
ncbi:hypothetical protein CY34DRAFT_380229 [Suillus luteus UH-Slu-Lm8-n1]|uniref:Uncharacterized protein n=1 Tax=Suillus luteus UH-Slu-Lm8-n1 TaxID=930992 RepID=A0A0D0A940_9AGAM|nr:hypothetical protein CY34DRAFT_380229 [Suillus luteus UH-Slu-Lm8-n1]